MIASALKWVGDVDGFLELVDQRKFGRSSNFMRRWRHLPCGELRL
jgi:hypothetical protein